MVNNLPHLLSHPLRLVFSLSLSIYVYTYASFSLYTYIYTLKIYFSETLEYSVSFCFQIV